MAIRSVKSKVRAFENQKIGRAVIVWNDDTVEACALIADLLAAGEIEAAEQLCCVDVIEKEPSQWLH